MSLLPTKLIDFIPIYLFFDFINNQVNIRCWTIDINETDEMKPPIRMIME